MSSAVLEVLSTPKLLRIIFSLSDDNRSNLLVNKTWAEEVISVEWNEVDQPERLFRLLAPLVRSRRDLGLYTFNRPLESTDWDRFNRYASRVKAFIQDSILLDAFSIKALYKTRDQTQDGLLPNVDYVCCPIDPDLLNIYLHPRLHSLTLCLDLDLDLNLQHSYVNVRNIKKSFSIISQRVASSLEVLRLNCQLNDYLLRFADEKLASTLRELTELSDVTIPPHWLSDRVTLALASLPKLVSVETLELQGLSETHIVATLSPLLERHSFPLLTSLSLLVPFEKAISAFSSWGGSARLLSLFIDSEKFETPERYKTMVRVISNAFPSLQRLRISAVSTNIPPNIPTPHLGFDAVEPLLRLRFLILLRVCYTTPLQLTSDDFTRILCSLQSINELGRRIVIRL